MPTNTYFRNFDARNEQELLHSLVTESIQIYGHDVNYIPRTLVNEDKILGEDSISEYNKENNTSYNEASFKTFETRAPHSPLSGVTSNTRFLFDPSSELKEKISGLLW